MTLCFDPQVAVDALGQQDRKLGRLMQRVGPFRLEPRKKLENPFQSLLRAIVYQQLSGKAAATIHGRVLAQFDGRGGPKPEQILAAPEEALRGCGLSRNKVAAVKDLAAKTAAGIVPDLRTLRRLDDEEIIERLVSVRGIGQWTVEMLLIFHLGRPDVLPTSDLGVRKGFMLTYRKPELPTKQELIDHGERWRPYRSVASWYMWRATEILREKPQAAAPAATKSKRAAKRS